MSEKKKKNILVIGAGGKIGRLFCKEALAVGFQIKAMVRSKEQAAEFKELGIDSAICDLENGSDEELNQALSGVDYMLFTAGSGGHTGGDKTLLVDLWGAFRVIKRAAQIGIEHFIMVSALRADKPLAGPEKLRHYLVAKNIADDELRRSGMPYTIVRPGRLTDDEATDRVNFDISKASEPWLTSRGNVARFLVHLFQATGVKGRTIDLTDGNTSITSTFGPH